MPGITFQEQLAIRNAITEYIEKFGMTSLGKVVDYIERKTGIETTPSTVGRIVREMGYEVEIKWEKR